MGQKAELTLFGGDDGWKTSDWTASDDRVRGGKSQSYLEVPDSSARFHGTLDIKTLGGAGFASQRTVEEAKTWDLSDYDGLRLDLGKADSKRYTVILKDELLPKSPNGREQATTSYEFDFNVSEDAALAEASFVFVAWKDFKPTYRGKEQKDASKLDKKNVKRFSLMMRSFFGDQEGDFSITVKSIKAVSVPADVEKGFVSEKDGSCLQATPDDDDDTYKQPPQIKRTVLSLLMPILAITGICLYVCMKFPDPTFWKPFDLLGASHRN
ncbi:complex I intermediate-associated protein 30-domain-containing protein [Massariosphaeria phaeospora]|uniref:Complex I intermediate-associated protein 30-domain-containing protein n=1 Tax=Massariosphaeria phaeospora TaxID=100035 RepID=A0A7C8IBB1_9PLEO|nr:complex I intermediate-associated protein 30-domain-containing protein [Massariosphaeria phaeospora]